MNVDNRVELVQYIDLKMTFVLISVNYSQRRRRRKKIFPYKPSVQRKKKKFVFQLSSITFYRFSFSSHVKEICFLPTHHSSEDMLLKLIATHPLQPFHLKPHIFLIYAISIPYLCVHVNVYFSKCYVFE